MDEQRATIAGRLARLAVVDVGVPIESVPTELHAPLAHLCAAADTMGKIFLQQVHEYNVEVRRQLVDGLPDTATTLELFDIMYGPFDRLDSDEIFYECKGKDSSTLSKAKGATFYPRDMSEDEFEQYCKAHPQAAEGLRSPVTLVRRSSDEPATVLAVPYSKAYAEELGRAAEQLRRAAAGLTAHKQLHAYLLARADAFASNEYRASDAAWLACLDAPLELVFGPYEVYEDELLGCKAAFEGFVAVRDAEESTRLSRIQQLLPEMQRQLPLESLREQEANELPFRLSVVNVLKTSGDSHAGVQTMAFVLPNDEVVREQHGTKKVLLRNVMQAKFNAVLLPIAKAMLVEDQVSDVTFEAFYRFTLMHEVSHALGPNMLEREVDGVRVQTTVSRELKELYSIIEEAKADILGVYNALLLVDQGFWPKSFKNELYASFLAGFFRSVRFGASEAHAVANVLEFSFLVQAEAVVRCEDTGKFAYVSGKMPEAIRLLARKLLELEALGDYEAARGFIAEHFLLPCCVKDRMDEELAGVPVDIRPQYSVEEHLVAWMKRESE